MWTPVLATSLVLGLGCGEAGPGEDLSEAERARELLEARAEGLAHLQRDRVEEARESFRRLVELAPEEAVGYASLALVHLRAGDLEEAERLAREAADRAPEDPEPRLTLARVLEERGDPRAARRELEAALEIEGRLLRAHGMAAELHAAPGPLPDPEAHRRHLARVLELAPANAAARARLAVALAAAGREDSAALHLEALRQQVPELPPDVTTGLGEAIEATRSGAGEALGASRRFLDAFRLTGAYQAAERDLDGPRGRMSGLPLLRFSHELSLRVREQEAVLAALRFAEASAAAGLAGIGAASGGGAVLASADIDADGDADLFVAWPGEDGVSTRAFLLRSELGRFVDATGASDFGAARFAAGRPPAEREAGAGGVRLEGRVTAARFGDLDNDGHLDLWLVRDGGDVLLLNRGDGTFEDATEAAGVGRPADGRDLVFADLDTDGDLDVFVTNRGPDHLWRNDGDGGFTEVAGPWGLAGDAAAAGRAVAFGDFDDDGDLDLFVANEGAPSVLYENLRGGRFEPVAGGHPSGAAGGGEGPREADPARGFPEAAVVVAADADNDGRLDLLTVAPGGGPPTLWRNLGGLRFEADARAGRDFRPLAGLRTEVAVFVDVDNDGLRDVLAAGRPVEEGARGVRLLRNLGEGRFEEISAKLPDPGEKPAAEGRPAGTASGAHSDGFSAVSVADYNEDGDLDLFLAGAGGTVRLWRNDGGDANHHVRIRLTGLATGSGKVNRDGIGSRLELRAGDLVQVATVTEPVTHFGLDGRLKADVIRIEWTNGVPQTLYFPGTDEDLREEQTLKGSCAFVYAWDGERFGFVTDAVWKSALGMPVGIMGGGDEAPASTGSAVSGPERRVYAGPEASREYVRIPGSALQPREGAYELRITEELWEVAYLDEVKLLAVDHPDSVEVFVDERFVPPGPPELRLFRVARRHLPVAARDGRGHDLLERLRAKDDLYVSNLVPGRWQGITEPHELVLDLGPAASGRDSVVLFLQGWVYPTDASINVAMAQAGFRPRPPVLEVRDAAGAWVPATDLSFPAGKDKTVIADLAGAWRSESREVRVRTDLQVYWDHAFFAVGSGVVGPAIGASAEELAGGAGARRVREAAERRVRALATSPAAGSGSSGSPPAEPAEVPARVSLPGTAGPGIGGSAEAGPDLRLTLLRPVGAELRYRGFSREYRKGGRFGPHWFDYDVVSEAPRWRPIRGRATRYGEVGPLLLADDDLYAILAPGDEAAVRFPADAAPELPPGWRRDFLLYTVGWIKDADRNTAAGSTVEPLPRHGMDAYPPSPDAEPFPSTELHRLWDRALNTRRLPAATEVVEGPG